MSGFTSGLNSLNSLNGLANLANLNNYMSYITYTIAGPKVQDESITRRYSEIVSLREKLIERWPGIYIPSIPPKKSLGIDKTVLMETRTHLLNHFFYSLSKIFYLFESEEVGIFISNTEEPLKTIEELPKRSYKDLIYLYSSIFPGLKDDYDLHQGKQNITNFHKLINKGISQIKLLKKDIINLCINKNKELKSYYNYLKNLESFEKNAVQKLTEKDEKKLLFANPANNELRDKLSNLFSNSKNPFIEFIWWLEEQELDYQGYDEAIIRFFEFEGNIDLSSKKIIAIKDDIRKIQTGQKTFFGIGKTKETRLDELQKEEAEEEQKKEKIEKLVKLIVHSYESIIENFKKEKSEDFYIRMKNLAEKMNLFEESNINLWKIVKEGINNYKNNQ